MTRHEGRKFGLTLGLAFSALAALLWWREHGTVATVLVSLGAFFLVAALVLPTRLGPIEKAWMGLALLISKVTTPIFMGIVYYIVVVPIGIVMRAIGRNPLIHPAKGDSFWVDRTEQEPHSDMRRQF